jgi:glycyl-tRNA synthetase beta chain
LDFDIREMIELLEDLYQEFDKNQLEEFIVERIYKSFDANASVIKAVLLSGERDINQIAKKVEALKHIIAEENFREIFSTFKRVANISKDVDLDGDLSIDESLFESEFEGRLKETFDEVNSKSYSSYQEQLEALFGLKEQLEEFFDNVLVNSEDEKLKRNRQNLIASIYRAFREIADIKEISV